MLVSYLEFNPDKYICNIKREPESMSGSRFSYCLF